MGSVYDTNIPPFVPVFGILCVIAIVVGDYLLMIKAKKQKTATTILVSTLLLTFVFPLIAFGLYTAKFKSVLKTNCDMATKSPEDNSVDVFLDYVKEWGFWNEPQQWNQIRGVWFIINESSNVSTAKKKELRDFLIVNGLRLNNSEKQIVDNYKG